MKTHSKKPPVNQVSEIENAKKVLQAEQLRQDELAKSELEAFLKEKKINISVQGRFMGSQIETGIVINRIA